MEHFKKRLIHQHQKPYSSKLSRTAELDDGDEDASSNSSTSSCSNSMIRPENKKEGNPQLKVARKRAVCRSKFRHNSLKIFKLGTSIPTSLCKSKEPYNVSAEKNLQLCCEDAKDKRKNRKDEKLIQKQTITEQIINSIEGNNKKEHFQRSISANFESSTKCPGKHNLPAIIAEIPVKRRNSLSKSSEDEQKISDSCRKSCVDSEYTKFDNLRVQSIYQRRNTVIGTEAPRDYLNDPNSIKYSKLKEDVEKQTIAVSNNEISYKLLEKLERISPDSTFTEKEMKSTQYPSLKQFYNNISPTFTPSSSEVLESMHMPLPVNIVLPHNTSITPIVPATNERYQHSSQIKSPTKRTSSNFYNSSNNNNLQNEYLQSTSILPVRMETTENNNSSLPNLDNPINLSVKRNNESSIRPPLQLPYLNEFKSNNATLPFPYSEGIFKNGGHFPEIQQQISRLENMPSIKPFEESFARAIVQRVKSVMFTPFSVDNLLVLNDLYKKLINLTCSKKLSNEILRNLKDVMEDIILYTNNNLFENKSQIFKNYTRQIMEFDLEHHRALLNDVIHLLRKNRYDHVWMGHFLIVLSRNRPDVPQISPNKGPNSSLYPSLMPQYFPLDDKELRQKVYKSRRVQVKKRTHHPKLPPHLDPLYNSNNIRNESYPSDSRYIPPKPESFEVKNKNNLVECKNKPQKDHEVLIKTPKVDKENDFIGNADKTFVNDTVIVKDESMEVTRENAEIRIKKENEIDKDDVVVKRVSKTEIVCIKKESADEKNETKEVSTDDLHLFKELLKQEDKNIYNRIVNKILYVKETAKDVITIDDEEDMSTQSNRLREILTNPQSTVGHTPPKKINTSSLKSPDVVIIDDDTEDNGFKEQKPDLNKNYLSVSKFMFPNKTELHENVKKALKRKGTSKQLTKNNVIEKNPKPIESIRDTKPDKKFESVHPPEDTKRKKLKLDIKKPRPYKMPIVSTPEHGMHPNYQIFESSKVFTPPNNTGRPYLSQPLLNCRTPEDVTPMISHSPSDINSSVVPYSNLGPLSTQASINSNWKSWISEERKKGFLDARPPTHRRQSVETISSVGSDYSPNLDHDENYVKIRVDAKWYRIKKSVMESIPRGKLCYVRENNCLIRYYDDNQLAQFIQNMNINLVGPAAFDFLKQIRERVDGYLSEDIFITPYEVTEKNQAIQLSENISFTKDDYISIPELYVEEMEKVERFVPKDFLGFYKYVTGYQIVNNHHPISFQTFLTMHNTNGIKMFYKRYLLSILENKFE